MQLDWTVVKKYWPIGILLLGTGLLGLGFWEQIKPAEVMVEIVKGNPQTTDYQIDQLGQEIMVDVEGAVERPGVYKLPPDSRIGDALVVAGGLSAMADREWVATTLNLAAKIEDSGKIYIPRLLETDQVGEVESYKQISSKININRASISELDSLDGIGEIRAKAIVDNRPYSDTHELVTRAKISESVYEKIKDKVSVY